MTKRPLEDSREGSQHKRAKKNTFVPTVDPRTGQRYALIRHDLTTTVPDIGVDFESDSDAMAYLNSVR